MNVRHFMFATCIAATASQAQAALTDGLVAYYPFDGSANDTSGNSNNGTVFGGVTFQAGVMGLAARFDGSTGYISASSAVGNLGNDATIAFWFRPDAASFSPRVRIVVASIDHPWGRR